MVTNTNGELRAGANEVEITPPLGGPMAGFGARQEPSTDVHDPLFARALAIEGEGGALVLISLDTIDPLPEITRQVRERIAGATELGTASVALAATHTHGGPELYDDFYAEWIPTLVERIADCAIGAWNAREPIEAASFAVAVEDVGWNRRGTEIVDREATGLVVRRPSGEVVAAVVNYACHPTVLGPDNRRITADYPGYLARALKRELGPQSVPLFLQGAAGDINQGHRADLSALGAPLANRTYARAEELGERLATAVVGALPSASYTSHAPVAMSLGDWAATFRTDLPPIDEARRRAAEAAAEAERLAGAGAEEEALQEARVAALFAGLVVRSAEDLARKGATAPTQIQVGRIGETGLAIVPGELFVEIGLAVKAASPFMPTMVVGYANDDFDYIPTAAAFSQGGYEPTRALYRPETGEELMAAAAKALAELHASAPAPGGAGRGSGSGGSAAANRAREGDS